MQSHIMYLMTLVGTDFEIWTAAAAEEKKQKHHHQQQCLFVQKIQFDANKVNLFFQTGI